MTDWTRVAGRGESVNVVTNVSAVRVPKAGEMVAAQLRRQIVLGELKEGDQLPPESVLMEEFGVSRPTLRGALLSDVYEVRAVLEPAAARMAAKRRTSADLTRLQEALDRHRESLADPAATITADADFHRLIVELSGNETLQVLTGMVSNIIREGD